MTVQAFYQASLALPIALPLVALPFWFLERGSENAIVFFLVASLYLGGLPYLIAALGTWRWMRGKSERQVRRASFLAPLIVLPLCWLWWTALFLVIAGARPDSGLEGLAWLVFLSPYVLIVGYVYVALVHFGLQLFRVLCWVQDESAA